MKKSKTCVVISWNGEGKERAARSYEDMIAQWGGIPVIAAGVREILPGDHLYKHVGNCTRSDGKESTDVASKMCSVKVAGAGIKRHVLANEELDVQTRVSAAHTHVFLTGEFGAGTWSDLTPIEKARVNRSLSDVYRIIDGSERGRARRQVAWERQTCGSQQALA